MSRTWRIGEVAERTGLTRRTLRHYDELGLLVPAARSWSDYRLYDSADLLRLLQIQNLKALGLSLSEIAEALSDPSLDATATLRGHLELLTEKIAAEQRLADQLRAVADSDERSWEDVLEAIALTRLQTHVDPLARLRAALGPEGRSTEELFTALATEDNIAVVEVLVWALAGRPGVAAMARAQLRQAEPSRRPIYIRLLAKASDREAVETLVSLLAESDPATVAAAVTALRQLPDPRAASALAALLGSGLVSDPEISDALVAIGPPAAVALAPLVASSSTAVRLGAIEAVGALASAHGPDLPAAAELLAALDRTADDPELALRRGAVVALAEFGPAGRAHLRTRVDDPTIGPLVHRLIEAAD